LLVLVEIVLLVLPPLLHHHHYYCHDILARDTVKIFPQNAADTYNKSYVFFMLAHLYLLVKIKSRSP